MKVIVFTGLLRLLISSGFQQGTIITKFTSYGTRNNLSWRPRIKMLGGYSSKATLPTFERSTDRRDSIPFSVRLVKDQGKSKGKPSFVDLGSFMLDPSTSCGDYLDLGGPDRTYEVTRVAFVYRYENRKYNVFMKKLNVVKANPSWKKIASSGDILQ